MVYIINLKVKEGRDEHTHYMRLHGYLYCLMMGGVVISLLLGAMTFNVHHKNKHEKEEGGGRANTNSYTHYT